jgi:hypothetical protein
MEIKVKEVGVVEEKSAVEVEETLIEKVEQQHEEQTQPEAVEQTEAPEETQGAELKEEEVLNFIKNRYDKDISSVDQLFAEKESNDKLPEDVSAYFEYKKKTGRGIEDYVKLNRDFDSLDEDQILTEYLLATEEGIDKEDVELLMEDYSYDEELDDESDIKRAKLKKKKAIVKAKKFFNEQKEMYHQPLESSATGISEDNEDYKAYKQYVENAKTQSEEQSRKVDFFEKETDKVLNQDFKGFKVSIDEANLLYNPGGSVEEIRKSQSSVINFINNHLNEDGLVKNAAEYHKALSAAMNPDKFARFFYEQGKAAATDDVTRKMKNINMSTRSAPEVTSKGGTQFRAINPSEGKGLRIKSIKRKN